MGSIPNELKTKTDEELADWQATVGKPHFILAENEWRRREKLEQHGLNKEIIQRQHEFNLIVSKKQSRLLVASIVAALVGVILGAILSSWLPTILSAGKQETPMQSAQNTPKQ